MERLTKRLEDGQAIFHECHGTCGTCDGANCYCIGPMVDRLAAYEDFMDRWHLKSIEDAERIFRRVNDLGGTDLMAQYRELGSINHLRDLLQAEQTGQLVVLPCKVGDTVYRVLTTRDCPPVISEVKIKTVGQAADLIGRMGKRKLLSYYLTREEAEAAMAQEGGTHEDSGGL